MGKGQIISVGTDGQYSVKLLYDRTKALSALDRVNRWITAKEEQIDKYYYSNPEKLPALKLALASLKKWKEYYESIPEDPTISTTCADYSEELNGDVGTIEVDGDIEKVIVKPGYSDNAAYSQSDDGQLQHIKAMTPEQWYYNAAMKPGWQKWMPTYRTGVVSNLSGDVCSVTMDAAQTEIYQASPADINQQGTLNNVPIYYMNCNGSAFRDGDNVVVKFIGRDWSNPQVIGFADGPKPCDRNLIVVYARLFKKYSYQSDIPIDEYDPIHDLLRGEYYYDYQVYEERSPFFVWDIETNDYAADDKKIYWMDSTDPDKIKHYLKKTDYPFTPTVDGDILADWKYRTQQVILPIYQYEPIGLPAANQITHDRESSQLCPGVMDRNNPDLQLIAPVTDDVDTYADSSLSHHQAQFHTSIECGVESWWWDDARQTWSYDGTFPVGTSAVERTTQQLKFGVFRGYKNNVSDFPETFLDVADFIPQGSTTDYYYQDFCYDGDDEGETAGSRELFASINTMGMVHWRWETTSHWGNDPPYWTWILDTYEGDKLKTYGHNNWLSETHAVQVYAYHGNQVYAQCAQRDKITGVWDVSSRSTPLESACEALMGLLVFEYDASNRNLTNAIRLDALYYKGPTQTDGMLAILNDKRESL